MERQGSAVVFDFDRTLTKRHLFHLMHDGHPVHSVWDRARWPHIERANLLQDREFLIEDVFGGAKRVAALADFLDELLLQGVTLYVSSLNFIEPVKLALRQVGLLDYFAYINARSAVLRNSTEENMRTHETLVLPGSKEYYLEQVVTRRHACTVFIDDELYHKVRQSQLLGAHNLHQLDVADPEGGVGERDFARIRELLAHCAQQLCCVYCAQQALYYVARGDLIVCASPHCVDAAAAAATEETQ